MQGGEGSTGASWNPLEPRAARARHVCDLQRLQRAGERAQRAPPAIPPAGYRRRGASSHHVRECLTPSRLPFLARGWRTAAAAVGRCMWRRAVARCAPADLRGPPCTRAMGCGRSRAHTCTHTHARAEMGRAPISSGGPAGGGGGGGRPTRRPPILRTYTATDPTYRPSETAAEPSKTHLAARADGWLSRASAAAADERLRPTSDEHRL